VATTWSRPANPENTVEETVHAAVAASNDFAFGLLKKVGVKPRNLLFSPASIAVALAMTAQGARGETRTQLERGLGFEASSGAPFQDAFEALHHHLAALGSGTDVEFQRFHRLWSQEGIAFEPGFLEASRTRYAAPLEPLDFVGAPHVARQRINRWVASHTRERIQELIPPGAVNVLTRLVLTTGLCFKARWKDPFEPRLTERDRPFMRSVRETVRVAMMTATRTLRYGEDADAQWLELPYAGGHLSMVIALPQRLEGVYPLAEGLDDQKLRDAVAAMREREVRLSLPRFNIASGLMLEKELSGMGMPLPFDPERADFSGITPREPLALSTVLHQATVEVDEHGTVATAASAVSFMLGGIYEKRRITAFMVDHPFLFFIRDVNRGAVIFLGMVDDPTR
jgi:serpin B